MLFVACFCIALTGILFAVAFSMAKAPGKVSYVDRLKKAQSGMDAVAGGLRDAEVMDKSLLQRVILPLSEKYASIFKGITPTTMIEQCELSIAQAGMQNSITGVQLTTISWVLASAIPLGVGFMFMPHVLKGMISPTMFLVICFVCMVLGYRLPRGIIEGKAKKRKNEIQLALPFTFDLISISVEAGMAFDGAMAIVAERTKGALSDELRRTLREINLGVARTEALTNLSRRTGVDDLRSFITAVNYISRLGGSLVDVIKIQTESMRVKRRQRAEQKANQAPVKIMIPLVLFIFPCLFIVILGPAGLTLMGGGLNV